MPASYATTRQVLVGDSSIVNKNKIRQNHMDDQFVVYSNQLHLHFFSFFLNFPSPMGRIEMGFTKAWTKYTGEQILVGPLLLLSKFNMRYKLNYIGGNRFQLHQ